MHADIKGCHLRGRFELREREGGRLPERGERGVRVEQEAQVINDIIRHLTTP